MKANPDPLTDYPDPLTDNPDLCTGSYPQYLPLGQRFHIHWSELRFASLLSHSPRMTTPMDLNPPQMSRLTPSLSLNPNPYDHHPNPNLTLINPVRLKANAKIIPPRKDTKTGQMWGIPRAACAKSSYVGPKANPWSDSPGV